MAHRIGIIGLGKIAQDQHVPAIRANSAFALVATSSTRAATVPGVPVAHTDYHDMLAMTDLDAVAICTPPQVRHAIARDALLAGKHALLEKPPAATLSELADLQRIAAAKDRVLFATWHAQFNAGVEAARAALAGQRVKTLLVTWKEDVRRWHPGQDWIWDAGGFGVFDPGINALSILARILPAPIFVRRADLQFPANKDAPIAADLVFGSDDVPGESLRAVFDWRQTGPQTWEVDVETEAGTKLALSGGGTRLAIDGRVVVDEPEAEYPGIYKRFDELLNEGRSEVDETPFRHLADAFMIGRRITVEPFEDGPAAGGPAAGVRTPPPSSGSGAPPR
jgi:D-galactose 1-dehydrogenase